MLLFSCHQNPSLLQIVSLCLPKNIPFCFRSLIWSNLPVAVSARVALCNTALLHFKQATCCCCQWCQYMKPPTTMLNIWVMSQSWKYGGWETPWSDEKLKGAVNQWSEMTILQIVIKLVMPTKKYCVGFIANSTMTFFRACTMIFFRACTMTVVRAPDRGVLLVALLAAVTAFIVSTSPNFLISDLNIFLLYFLSNCSFVMPKHFGSSKLESPAQNGCSAGGYPHCPPIPIPIPIPKNCRWASSLASLGLVAQLNFPQLSLPLT